MLRAIEVPPVGGDTLFADMAAAYLGLEDDVRARIDDLRAVHDFTLSFGQALSDEDRAAAQAQYPAVEHPVVRTHPETGERVLYVNAIFTSHVVGLPEDESRQLLAELYAHSVLEQNIYRHQWQPHDLVFWDNRSLIHLAAGCPAHLRRKLYRTTIQGDAPF